jgi:hypothetical protein
MDQIKSKQCHFDEHRFSASLMHLHSDQPEACVLSSDDKEEEEEKQDNGETQKRSSTIIDLIESDEEQEK